MSIMSVVGICVILVSIYNTIVKIKIKKMTDKNISDQGLDVEVKYKKERLYPHDLDTAMKFINNHHENYDEIILLKHKWQYSNYIIVALCAIILLILYNDLLK